MRRALPAMSPTSRFSCPSAIRNLLGWLTADARHLPRRGAFFLPLALAFVLALALGLGLGLGLTLLLGGWRVDFERRSMISTAGPAALRSGFARRFASNSAIALPRSAGDFTVRAPEASS